MVMDDLDDGENIDIEVWRQRNRNNRDESCYENLDTCSRLEIHTLC